SQIEVVTRPLVDAERARQDLHLFRQTLADVGKKYGIGILAAGTHPLARPDEHLTTNKRRYTKVIKELGIVGLGNALCGLHVHVEVPDPDLRVEILPLLVPFLPILLASKCLIPISASKSCIVWFPSCQSCSRCPPPPHSGLEMKRACWAIEMPPMTHFPVPGF